MEGKFSTNNVKRLKKCGKTCAVFLRKCDKINFIEP